MAAVTLQCKECLAYKATSFFYIRKESGKHRRECITCYGLLNKTRHEKTKDIKNARTKEHRKRNHERVLAYEKERRRLNPGRGAEAKQRYAINNPEKVREARRAWKRNNPAKVKAATARRRAQKLQATPPWADHREINKIYALCPLGHEVDHIVPLLGKNVCGLHVPWNLKPLSKSENRRKSNKLINELGE